MNISLRWNQLESDEKVEKYIIDKIKPLEKVLPSIIEAGCELERDTRHQSGQVFRFEVNLEVPSKVLRAQEWGSTPYEAIDLVKDEISRQIKKYKDTMGTKQKSRGREIKENTHVSTFADINKAQDYLKNLPKYDEEGNVVAD